MDLVFGVVFGESAVLGGGVRCSRSGRLLLVSGRTGLGDGGVLGRTAVVEIMALVSCPGSKGYKAGRKRGHKSGRVDRHKLVQDY